MTKYFSLFLFILINWSFSAQVVQIKYYTDEFLHKEVEEKKAKVSLTLISNNDGSETKEVHHIKNKKLIRSETHKGEEPYGIWLIENRKGYDTLDYNFELDYSSKSCKFEGQDTSLKSIDFFKDFDSLQYIAPKFSGGEVNIYKYISIHIHFPLRAREEGISGKVFLSFIFNEKAGIDNIVILKGAHVILDKEAVRVLREVRFLNPPYYKGRAVKICFNLPISFKIQ